MAFKGWEIGKCILILDPVTGRSGGNKKRTVVTITYASPI